MGELQRLDHRGSVARKGRLDLFGADGKDRRAGVEPVETQAEIGTGVIAARPDILDDGAHIGLDILRDLALGGQKRGKAGFEIRRRWH
jgi:hypothetical protein